MGLQKSYPHYNKWFLREQHFNVQCSKKSNNVKKRNGHKKSFCHSLKQWHPLLLKTVQRVPLLLLERDRVDLHGKV